MRKFPKLRVVPRSRAFRYKGESVDVQQAGRELQVQAVLSGRLLIRGETLVIKMDLIDVERDAQLWGQQYTKKFSDIFALQEEIADEVADALKIRLSGETKKRATRQTQNPEAYELYLKGTVSVVPIHTRQHPHGDRVFQPGHRQGSELRAGICGTCGLLCLDGIVGLWRRAGS